MSAPSAARLKSGDNRAAVLAAATLARPVEHEQHDTGDKLWHVAAAKGHIMASACAHNGGGDGNGLAHDECNTCTFRRNVAEGELPEMVFDHNKLTLRQVASGATIEWDALDALKRVDAASMDPSLQVAASAEWQSSRGDVPELARRSKHFDWTFCTHYDGTLNGFRATETTASIDLDVLRRREPIAFYAEVPLFEDELADHGAASYSVRVRCMPAGVFVLARYYLRVDSVLARVIDTRVFAAAGSASPLREFTVRECPVRDMSPAAAAVLHQPDELWQHLPVVEHKAHRLDVCV